MKKKISRNNTISLINCIISELLEELEEVIRLTLGLYFCNNPNET